MMLGIRKKILRGLGVLLLSWSWVGAQQPAENDTHHDVLVYKDGDKVRGRLVDRTPTTIVFKSDRFGELRVPADDAVVILAEKPTHPVPATPLAPPPPPALAQTEPKTAAQKEREEEEKLSIWEWFSPSVLTAKVRNFFGPWHGRFAFSTEVVSDTSDRSNTALDTRLQRKWEKDEIVMSGRFDYSNTNQVTTTDVLKADGSWRHDFNKRWFSIYHPTLEWNRANKVKGLPSDYLLMQQEIGAGVNVFSRPTRKVRAGVSENLFDVWTFNPGGRHSSRTVESVFFETELTLPWRMAFTQRGIWYYPLRQDEDGWENRMDLNKKLTETLSVAIRHEIRRNNPDERVSDYTRLKLLLGLDF